MLELVQSANSVLWGPVLLLLLCGTGIWYTVSSAVYSGQKIWRSLQIGIWTHEVSGR